MEAYKMSEELQALLDSYRSYSKRAIDQLAVVAEKCYQDDQGFVWDAIEDFLDAMEFITQGLVHISSTYSSFSELNEAFAEQFKALLHAMETKDIVTIGDILSYEISPLFELLLKKIDEVYLAE